MELRTSAVVAGGDALARDADGRVVLVEGALPDETVRVELLEDKPRMARGRVVDVVEASPHRVAPPCVSLAAGCGGCSWQHVARAAQPALKAAIVEDALRRIAKRRDHPPVTTVSVAGEGRRTTVRMAVVDGRAAFHRRHSDDRVVIDGCAAVDPLLEELMVDGRYDGADEIVLRVASRTGQRLVLARPTAAGVRVPAGVVVVGGRGNDFITEQVAGRRWRISARSFFQSSPEVAEALVDTVADAVGDTEGRDGRVLVDLYAGVGLFAGALAERRSWRRVTAVESSVDAAGDARINLADVGAKVVQRDVATWRGRGDVVVADPARTGLGRPGVATVVASGAEQVALVSCDPASMARDVGLLSEAGYELRSVAVLDAFPDTPHVEAVTTFERTSSK